jgi:hypothetical protein
MEKEKGEGKKARPGPVEWIEREELLSSLGQGAVPVDKRYDVDYKTSCIGFLSSCKVEVSTDITAVAKNIWQRQVGTCMWVGFIQVEYKSRCRVHTWTKVLQSKHPVTKESASAAFLRIYKGPKAEMREKLINHFLVKDNSVDVGNAHAVMEQRKRAKSACLILKANPMSTAVVDGGQVSDEKERKKQLKDQNQNRYEAVLDAFPAPGGEAWSRLRQLVSASKRGQPQGRKRRHEEGVSGDDEMMLEEEAERLVWAEIGPDALTQKELWAMDEAEHAEIWDGRLKPYRRGLPPKASAGF